MTNLTIVAAMDLHRGIGIRNQLPWNLPEDLEHFKRVTMGQCLIMGRKTFDSIGRPLPGRHNMAVTRDERWRRAGVSRFLSVEAALCCVGDLPTCIIGGAEIYKATLPHADRLVLTRIHSTFKCDAFFPVIDTEVWGEVSRETHTSAQNKFDYAVITYLRNKDGLNK